MMELYHTLDDVHLYDPHLDVLSMEDYDKLFQQRQEALNDSEDNL